MNHATTQHSDDGASRIPMHQVTSRPRHRYVKSLSLGLTDILFSPARWPWVFFELLQAFLFFQVGVWSSPYGIWGTWPRSFVTCGAVFAFCFVAFALGLGFYDRANRFKFSAIFRISIVGSVLAHLVAVTVFYFAFYGVAGRLTLVYGAIAALISIIAMRSVLAWLMRRNPYRFTILGNSPLVKKIAQSCSIGGDLAHAYRFTPWDRLFDADEEPSVERLLVAKIGDIVLTQEALGKSEAIDFAILSLQAKFRVMDETEFYTQVFERLPIEEVSKEWVLRQGIARRQIFTVTVKRLLDFLLASLTLIIISPLLLLIMLIIKLSSPGPIFFNQMRQGRYSQPFKMYKFRTMTANTCDQNAKNGFTKQNDSRVTWIGRVLRPLHLDELPQLLNILIGDMSLVGPRPEALEFAQRMRKEVSLYDLRYLVRPGLTGHAQLNQGYAMDNAADTKTKLSYDLYYLCHQTFWLDMQIMLRTVFFLTRKAR